jgi:hypothetical protein
MSMGEVIFDNAQEVGKKGGSTKKQTTPPITRPASNDKEISNKISTLMENSDKPLYKCTAVWPFDFFPNEISIEVTQINVKKRFFYGSERVSSIPIKNLADVIVTTSPFFASLEIIDSSFTENSVKISYLPKKDAEKAREIIQGLIVASKEGIDLTKLDVNAIKRKLQIIGNADFS